MLLAVFCLLAAVRVVFFSNNFIEKHSDSQTDDLYENYKMSLFEIMKMRKQRHKERRKRKDKKK